MLRLSCSSIWLSKPEQRLRLLPLVLLVDLAELHVLLNLQHNLGWCCFNNENTFWIFVPKWWLGVVDLLKKKKNSCKIKQ